MNKPSNWLAGLLVAGLCGAALAAAPTHQHGGKPWTGLPLLEKARGFSRSMILLRPVGLTTDGATVLPSVAAGEAPATGRVALNEGKLAVRSLSPKQGGYYRVAAMQQDADGVRIASTVVYFSNPGPAPRAMLAQSAMPLEIVPAELPREHRHYRSGETWSFQLRRDGQPLVDHLVQFESAQGSRESLHSDAQGMVTLRFPDDIPAVEADQEQAGHGGGHGADRRSAFVLSARALAADGQQLLTAFNYEYRPGAYAGKSLWLGGGFALLGMLAATPLLRRRTQPEVTK